MNTNPNINTDYIGIYKNSFPEGFCNHLIEQFSVCEEKTLILNRKVSENSPSHKKSDSYIFLESVLLPDYNGIKCNQIIHDALRAGYDDYSSVFSTLGSSGNLTCSAFKMQRSIPGEGYHVFHQEQCNLEPGRAITYMFYLNSLEDGEGGETEFLIQRKRIKPEANTLLLWPAGYTHPHRGNTVLGDTYKYILTGWLYYHKN